MKTTLLFLSVFLSANLFGQNVYIPDANFKEILVGNPNINTNGDTEIQVSEATSFNGTIYCINQNISDLTGIEAFTELTELDCRNNQITGMDLSQNTALIELEATINQLTSLDLSQNTLLCTLLISNNPLSSLDLSQNIALTYLSFQNTQLTSLDVSNSPALTTLGCPNNQLTSIDVSNNPNLIYFRCENNQLTSLDVSSCTDLYNFLCYHNQITSLDVSNNPDLDYLMCGDNQLTFLNVSNNPALQLLGCDRNQLTSLDASSCTALTGVVIEENNLECLNLKNGNNTILDFYVDDVGGNSNLNCIQVDNPAWSLANWEGFLGSEFTLSENCNYPSDCFTSSLTELTTSKNLIQILDMMGRETSFKPNTPLIYVYDDGSTEKVFSVEY